ncbi:MAG: hypothetical protein NVS4B7_01740 [Ktedonobacteraceae bacterium]
MAHANNPSAKMKLWRRPSLWIAVVSIALLLTAIITMSMRATASSLPHKQRVQPMPHTTAVLAVITNSGSTNTPQSTLTVNTDGSGSLHYQKDGCACVQQNSNRFVDKTFPVGTFNIAQLKSTLTQAGDVSAIPNHGCIKSVSFGSTTTVTYQGKTSGDLSCLSNTDLKIYLSVKAEVQTIYEQASKRDDFPKSSIKL